MKFLLFLAVAAFCLVIVNADVPVYCDQGGAVPDAQFSQFLANIRKESFNDQRNIVVQDFLQNLTRGFNSNQTVLVLKSFNFASNMVRAINDMSRWILGLYTSEVMQILNTFTFANDKLAVLPVIMNTITDPENKMDILACFTFQTDKDKAAQMLQGIKPRSCVFGSVVEKRVQFVIDVSGSMGTTFRINTGRIYTRLQFVVEQLDLVIRKQLSSDQQFNIFQFSSGVSSWKPGLVPVNNTNIDSAVKYIQGLRPGGGTNISGALQRAFADPNVVAVYLLSDGAPVEGITDLSALVKFATGLSNRGGLSIPINCIAFVAGNEQGVDKSKSRQVMEAIATATGGVYRSIEG